MRYGTRTSSGRRWTPSGHRPTCPVHLGYDFAYLYTALNPYNGDLFVWMLPSMKKESFKAFLEEFALHRDANDTILITDRAPNHRAKVLTPEMNIKLEYLPPYCPELNPVERFFEELRKELKDIVFLTIEQIEDRLEIILKKYWEKPSLVTSIAKYPYVKRHD